MIFSWCCTSKKFTFELNFFYVTSWICYRKGSLFRSYKRYPSAEWNPSFLGKTIQLWPLPAHYEKLWFQTQFAKVKNNLLKLTNSWRFIFYIIKHIFYFSIFSLLGILLLLSVNISFYIILGLQNDNSRKFTRNLPCTCHVNFVDRSFAKVAPSIWNQLPLAVRNASYSPSFFLFYLVSISSTYLCNAFSVTLTMTVLFRVIRTLFG
jgi:hypothetical protein